MVTLLVVAVIITLSKKDVQRNKDRHPLGLNNMPDSPFGKPVTVSNEELTSSFNSFWNRTEKEKRTEGNQNKKLVGSLSELFKELTTQQRYSVLNFLHLVCNIEGNEHKATGMLVAMNFYVDVLGVKAKDAMSYFETNGVPKIVADLGKLNVQLKEILVLMAHDFITMGAPPTTNELQFMGEFFSQIGISNEHYISVIKKNELIKEFMR